MTTPQKILLKDYAAPDFWCDTTDLDVSIFDDHVIVASKSSYSKNTQTSSSVLKLDGVDLELLEIKVNQEIIADANIKKEKNSIELSSLPDEFILEIKVKINPYTNLSGEGFYKSGNILCTQCEAEGFRRIMYFQDRPDVMSKFSTTITADKKLYPRLLSNGNKVETKDLGDGRHSVCWEDPFKKPCYLFAMVAGELALVEDSFQARDGRDIKLEIFVDPGNEEKCHHAMDSLKASMKWDEDRFGLIYDLDIYMIVAVDSFNMGAMENKGLNIFNSHYVLASQKTATDNDFQGVEAVIGHEYFHNWTGNRVTCRDWFQLTLKEGLTVFRDQEFSSDMGSRAVKRIEDIKALKSHQFSEDAGPLSHPIQPKSYIEINNFYTSTIYEKGAEVIRMIHTILGEDKFRAGIDLYFKRHDGCAVTCADFVSSMSDASGVDLEHFSVWYDQNGTPVLEIDTSYDEKEKKYEIKVSQKVKTNNEKFDCLLLPFYIHLYSKGGDLIEGGDKSRLILNQKESTFVFENISADVIPAFNIGFSAPVEVQYDYKEEELQTLMTYGRDEYIRYNATQIMYKSEMNKGIKLLEEKKELSFSDDFIKGIGKVIADETIDNSFKAYLLNAPRVKDLFDRSTKFDFDITPVVHNELAKKIATTYESYFENIFNEAIKDSTIYSLSPEDIGKRTLFSSAIYFLGKIKGESFFEKLYHLFETANNMTIEMSCLRVLMLNKNSFEKKASDHFYNKWKHETLVIQKWLALSVQNTELTISDLQKLEELPIYDKTVPNLLRALVGSYTQNITNLNNIDGSGYQYICGKILDIDSYNPQMAARLLRLINYLNKLDIKREELLRAELKKILDSGKLSNDCFEVVKKMLA